MACIYTILIISMYMYAYYITIIMHAIHSYTPHLHDMPLQSTPQGLWMCNISGHIPLPSQLNYSVVTLWMITLASSDTYSQSDTPLDKRLDGPFISNLTGHSDITWGHSCYQSIECSTVEKSQVKHPNRVFVNFYISSIDLVSTTLYPHSNYHAKTSFWHMSIQK